MTVTNVQRTSVRRVEEPRRRERTSIRLISAICIPTTLTSTTTPSRSQLRREALDVLKLAGTLADLTDAQLAAVPISDDLRDEVKRTRAVKQQIARKRQTQFLAKQMRRLDDDELAAIRASLEHDRDQARRDTMALHKIEQWRDRLIAQGDDALLIGPDKNLMLIATS